MLPETNILFILALALACHEGLLANVPNASAISENVGLLAPADLGQKV